MFHDTTGLLVFVLPALLLVAALLLPSRLMGGSRKDMDRKLESMQQRSVSWHQETAEFQAQLLAELRRHNELMERQSELMARLLSRSEQ